MAHKIREEGDYTYWSDGAQRYAKGNSQGKQAGGLAKRHPKAGIYFDKLAPHKLADITKQGRDAQDRTRRAKVRDAYAHALRSSHPDIGTETAGLHEIAEAAFVQATDDSSAAAVKARAQFIDMYAGTPKQDKHVVATQINITLSPGTGNDMSRFAQSIPITVEGEVVEEPGHETIEDDDDD